MDVHIDWRLLLDLAEIIGAVVAICMYFAKIVRWVDRQKRQDKEIAATKEELTLLTYGVLACLKGIKEQGCNGPVTETIGKIEKHLNQKAHK